MNKTALADVLEYREDRFTKRVLHQGDQLVFVLNFLPGQELPAHRHPGAEVSILVLEGEGQVLADDVAVEVGKGDALQLSGEENFLFRNTGDKPASLYVVLSYIPSPKYAQNV